MERRRRGLAFKLNVVETALKRGEKTLEQIAQQHGIGNSTLSRWMYLAKKGQLGEKSVFLEEDKRPQDLTLGEKFQALVDTAVMSDSDKGRYCRKKGFYPHHLTQWKTDFMSKNNNQKDDNTKAEMRKLKEENKRLQRELKRKEKALAEAAALLVLKKKADALFDSDEDN